MVPLIVSYYTEDPIYTECANRLRASLDKFGLEYRIVPVRPRGSWLNHIHYKANIIDAAMRTEKRDIIWLDADAEVMQYPELFEHLTGDIAAHMHQGTILNGATVFFKMTPVVLNLVEAWKVANKTYFRDSDQQNLQKVVEEYVRQGLISFEELPFSYARIFDYSSPEEAVIKQHQASRRGAKYYAAFAA